MSPSRGEPILWPLALITLLLPLVWLGIFAVIARVGGWQLLAESYPAPDGEIPESAGWRGIQTVILRRSRFFPVRYGGSLRCAATDRGLYLAPLFIFRFQHPRVLIPWREITECRPGQFLWARWVDVKTRRPGPSIRVFGALADAVSFRTRKA